MAQKDKIISVRLAASDRQALDRLCSVSGLPVSTVIRKLIGGVTIRQRRPEEVHELYVELNRIGTNINQITRKANAGFATKEDIRELKFLMRSIEKKVAQVIDQ